MKCHLVAISSRPPPDLHRKFKTNTLVALHQRPEINEKGWRLVHYTGIVSKLKIFGLVGRKSAMADATKTTACPIGHMTYTQAPVVYEKNIFHLFHFTQPVKNYSCFTHLSDLLMTMFSLPGKGLREISMPSHVFLPNKTAFHLPLNENCWNNWMRQTCNILKLVRL